MLRNRTITFHVKPAQQKILLYPEWYFASRALVVDAKKCLWCGGARIGKELTCSDFCKSRWLSWMPSAVTYRNVKSLPRWIHMRDKFQCKKCEFVFAVETPSGIKIPQFWGQCDHITALVNGGTDAIRNLQLLCDPCHKEKTLSDMKHWKKHKDDPF